MFREVLVKPHWTGIRGDKEFMEAMNEVLKRGINCWSEQNSEAGKEIQYVIARIENMLNEEPV